MICISQNFMIAVQQFQQIPGMLPKKTIIISFFKKKLSKLFLNFFEISEMSKITAFIL